MVSTEGREVTVHRVLRALVRRVRVGTAETIRRDLPVAPVGTAEPVATAETVGQGDECGLQAGQLKRSEPVGLWWMYLGGSPGRKEMPVRQGVAVLVVREGTARTV